MEESHCSLRVLIVLEELAGADETESAPTAAIHHLRYSRTTVTPGQCHAHQPIVSYKKNPKGFEGSMRLDAFLAGGHESGHVATTCKADASCPLIPGSRATSSMTRGAHDMRLA